MELSLENTQRFKVLLNEYRKNVNGDEEPIEDLYTLLNEFFPEKVIEHVFYLNTEGTITIKTDLKYHKPQTTTINGVVFTVLDLTNECYLLLNGERPVYFTSVYESNNIFFMADCMVHVGHEEVDVYNLITGNSKKDTFR